MVDRRLVGASGCAAIELDADNTGYRKNHGWHFKEMFWSYNLVGQDRGSIE
jgi:hypothetical protein